jgi:hypothetical protein
MDSSALTRIRRGLALAAKGPNTQPGSRTGDVLPEARFAVAQIQNRGVEVKPCCSASVGPEVMRLTFGARALTLDRPLFIRGRGFVDIGNGIPIPFIGGYSITEVVGTTVIIYSINGAVISDVVYFGEMLVSIQLVPGTTFEVLNFTCESIQKGQLTTLDLTGIVAENFNFYNNNISSILFDSVTDSPAWSFGSNNLSTLNLSTKTSAQLINVGSNPFVSLGLTLPTSNTNLRRLDVTNCNLSTLVPAAYPSLTLLYCASNSISTLDLSSNVFLEFLDCSGNPLTYFSVASNTALRSLNCSNLQLTTLDLSANTSLKELTCAYNQLTTLDISLLSSLEYLDCTGNQLKNLDVSANMDLRSIKCTDNDLSGNLYLSSNVLFISLDCSGNYLTGLNVSGCVDLTSAICSANRFSQGAADAIVSALVTNAALDGTLDFTGNTPTITNPGTGDWDILETTNGWTIIV